LDAQASPTIKHKLVEASKAIPNPADPFESYFDFWQRWNKDNGGTEENSEPEGIPIIRLPGINLIFNSS